jgi:hypothetical protein
MTRWILTRATTAVIGLGLTVAAYLDNATYFVA